MRIIKFRVWDTLAERYIYPNVGYQEHFILDLNGKFTNLQNGSGGSEYVVQQFTGYTDIAGREIYEGDLIKSFTHETVYEITWEEHRLVSGFFVPENYKECRVIGNCFEGIVILDKSN